jgi:hypothetical protein
MEDRETITLYKSDSILNYKSIEKLGNDLIKFSFLEGESYSSADILDLFYSKKKEKIVNYKEIPEVRKVKNEVYSFSLKDFFVHIKNKERDKGSIKVFSEDKVKYWEDNIWDIQFLAGENDIVYWTIDSSLNIYLVKKSIKSGETFWRKKIFEYIPVKLSLRKLTDEKILASDQDGVCFIFNYSNGELINDLSKLMNGSFTINMLPDNNNMIAFGKKLIYYDIKRERIIWEKRLTRINYGLLPLFHKDRVIVTSGNNICFYNLGTGRLAEKFKISASVDKLFKIYDKKLFFDTSDNRFCLIDLTKI